jgi:hypothetical protein
MSGSVTQVAGNDDVRQRWAALDSRNERLVDASDPLVLDLNPARDRDAAGQPRQLPTAS